MRIAVLGWGSLVWDRRALALAGLFQPNGPFLPLEFSRISLNRSLTLVIDEALGTPCATYAAPSIHGDLDQAIDNLRLRENMPGPDGVGFVDLSAQARSETAWERHAGAVIVIENWARRFGYDAVVWTALDGNFHERHRVGRPFSVDAAIFYLESLDGESLAKALEYIRKAPPEIRCPLRTAVDQRWPSD